MMNFLLYLFFLLVSCYAIMIFRWVIAWHIYPSVQSKELKTPGIKVSVLLAVRNEEQEIVNCVKALNLQQYSNLEIIVSDDFSEDNTRQLVRDYISSNNAPGKSWKLVEAIPGDGTGKKAALARALKMASGELIITTDADCKMSDLWVDSFVTCYHESNAAMITGFVRLQPAGTFVQQYQALEFLSLSGTGAASVITGKPLMCNGANLAFTKAAFESTGGYGYGGELSSGDDTFLMLQLAGKGQKIVFNKSRHGIVTSRPVAGFHEFVAQRKRWASKVRFYEEGYVKATGILIFSVNLVLLAAMVAGVTGIWSWGEVVMVWMVKAVPDFLFLSSVGWFADQRKLLLLFLPALLLYPFYALAAMLLAGGKVNYAWKGREYRLSDKIQ